MGNSNFYCTVLQEGQGVIVNRGIGYRAHSLSRGASKKMTIIVKGTKGIVCWAARDGDLCSVRFDGEGKISNIPSYYLEAI